MKPLEDVIIPLLDDLLPAENGLNRYVQSLHGSRSETGC
jgi:hypothetical protein